MKTYFFTTLFVGLFLISCGPKINSTQQENLKQLTNKVDSIAEEMNALDSAALIVLTNNFFERKNFIQQEMVDTLKPDIIFKLDAFIQLRKEMGYIRGEYFTIKNEANILKQQLKDLNHDVSKRLVEEKQFDNYFTLEKENYNELAMAASQLTGAIDKGTAYYEEMVSEIDSVITAYKANLNE